MLQIHQTYIYSQAVNETEMGIPILPYDDSNVVDLPLRMTRKDGKILQQLIESSYTASNATFGFHTTYSVPYLALLQIRRSPVGSQRRAMLTHRERERERERERDTL
jgi:hypothetical protein